MPRKKNGVNGQPAKKRQRVDPYWESEAFLNITLPILEENERISMGGVPKEDVCPRPNDGREKLDGS